MRGRRHDRNRGHLSPAGEVRGDPEKRREQRCQQEAGETHIQGRGFRRIGLSDQPRQHDIQCVADRRRQCEQRGWFHEARTRPQDNQDAPEADDHRRPAAYPDFFMQEEHRHRGHE